MRSYFERARRTGKIPLPFGISVGLPVLDKPLKSDYRSDREDVEKLIEDTNPYRGVDNFIDYLRAQGLNVKPTSRAALKETHGKDVVGWRRFNNIEYVPDKNPNITLERLGHEYAAGHDHELSDPEAQREAERVFRYEWPHEGARKAVVKIGKELNWLPKWYDMN